MHNMQRTVCSLDFTFFLFRFNFVAQFSKIRKKTTTHLPYLPVRFGKAVNSMSMHSLSMLTILAYYSD